MKHIFQGICSDRSAVSELDFTVRFFYMYIESISTYGSKVYAEPYTYFILYVTCKYHNLLEYTQSMH